MISTAVIGCGFSARTFHIPFIQASPALQLVALSTRQGEQARLDFPDVAVYPGASELLSDSDAQLVIITAPNDVHYELALHALQQGRHVVVDKPFVTSVAGGEELIAVAKDKGPVLSAYHNRRWDGDFLTVKQLIERGEVGEVHYFESHFDRFRPQVRQRWREQPGQGAGIWFDLGPHLLDQAVCLFGMPEALTGRCGTLRENSCVTDYFHVQLHYPRCEVVLHGSPFSAGPNARFQLQGSRGSYVKQGLDPQEDRLKAGVTPDSADWAAEAPADVGRLYTEHGDEDYPTKTGGYQHYYKELADAIVCGGEPPVTAEDALNVIRLVLLAQRSSELGRTLTL